ncbi:hypothetical protein [Streptomyces scabiei]|uniref:hypothetical protein n=1 Tax=Streptomyces scabiei TaxID=1930 RepID=UPI001B3075C5|nr:hypothetical protein [Streptomyces sp. LBUM 1475]QTU64265.1 hypothetical protein F3K22_27520 [Streptomyces sp. LBUM 1475]
MNLIEHALTVFTEGTAERAERDAEYAAEAREELLRLARGCAVATLAADAGDLDWQCTTEGLPGHVEEARALLLPGRSEYLRYRIDHEDADNVQVSFDLVRPCLTCGHDRITKVTSLFHLGQLLHEAEQRPATEDQALEEKTGPLTAVEVQEARASAMAGLARRLRAQYPDADLTVSHTVLIAHSHSGATATLNLTAADVDAARAVAAGLGTDLAIRTVEHAAPYPAVVEHANFSAMVDGVEVELTAYRHLTDDEATAWRAQQNQPADDQAPAAEAGDD